MTGGKVLGEAIAEVEVLAQKYLPLGYTHSYTGQAEAFGESYHYLIIALIQAIIIVYMVLAMQFNSFLHPLTVMLALPLSTVGAFGALYVTGDTLSILSMIGMITLTALVVKNSILLVDYTNALRERGIEKNEAILQASPVRLRPILMTAGCPGIQFRRGGSLWNGKGDLRRDVCFHLSYPLYRACGLFSAGRFPDQG
jgi:HAE1 family hydrophobic/amphiphilic exporter-1